MIAHFPFTRTDLEQALTAEQVRTTAIIRIALMLGVLFFYFSVIVLFSMHASVEHQVVDTLLMDALSIVHAVFAIGASAASYTLFRSFMKPERLTSAPGLRTPREYAAFAVGLYRTSTIVGFAPLEGVAFFGATICLIGIQNDSLFVEPSYWANAASGVWLLLVGLFTLPTRARMAAAIESNFLDTKTTPAAG